MERQQKFAALARALDRGLPPEDACLEAGYPNASYARRRLRAYGAEALAARTYESRPANAPQKETPDMARIEDLEFCLDTGEWPGRAIIRAGYATVAEAVSSAIAAGRDDLARRVTFDPLASEWDEGAA